MEISIVSGTYNRLSYLQKMVNSVRQSLAGLCGIEYEIVLVDGGSNDTTQEWCKLQPDIKLIEHDQLYGAVKAFNDGAFAATGKYVIMANDDIEFVGNSILLAYVYMETHPNCGGGCFYQNRNGRDWHVEGMPAVQIIGKGKGKQIHTSYAQVGIFHKWLGDLVHWWCDDQEFGRYLTSQDYKQIGGDLIGLHTYGGDNELSARIIDLGFTVDPIPDAKITDSEANDELRAINNIEGGKDPRSVRGHHPDSWKWGKKWFRRNERLGYRNLAGPILKDRPMIHNPLSEIKKERVLYLPLFEQGWQVQKEQKKGLRDALVKVALVYEYDYMRRFNQVGKRDMMYELEKICLELQPTIMIFQLHNSDQINSDDIKILRQKCNSTTKFVNWNGDYWPNQLLDDKGLSLARSFDLMTVVNRDVVEKHRQQGINTQYWQIGWEPEGTGYEPEFYHDVVFLASGYSSKRQELGQFLAKQSFSFGLYGNGWPAGYSKGENLYNFREACKIYRGAKIAIGDSQWPDSGFVSNRIMQILAAGNCVLCHQWFAGYERLGLVDKVNCLIWKDLADLEGILRYWLSDNSQKLSEIAANGEKLALERHSFDSRVSELWEMLGINAAIEQEAWRW
jgi:glycosyltransferase involved in cell wall biosynthesis